MGQDGDHTSQDVLPVLDFSAAVRGDGLASTTARSAGALQVRLKKRLVCLESTISIPAS